ncbi:Na+/H+ antiporter subunit G [Corynebacterium caspium]|uniref:Na+/H+ antiporter subunit G n=1 Tax=Corynebacterium caspium TaxID=234828 RepID=UPI00036C9C0E|nr:Na+/H+ antiporter subunit G [Corynebacterium caspium]WKD58550.1 putative monovalent cation/H+ antiporter subunit G [Corynebacterium caspium DSM 44850]
MTIPEIIISVLVLLATFFIVATTVALWRVPSALTRVNVLGGITCIALPLLIIALMIHDGTSGDLSPNHWIRAIIAILGLWFIGAVGSFAMGRAIYGVTVVDPGSAPENYKK